MGIIQNCQLLSNWLKVGDREFNRLENLFYLCFTWVVYPLSMKGLAHEIKISL